MGGRLAVGGEAVRLWETGAREPSRVTVFALEQLVKVKAGTLSKELGYLPVNAKPAASVREAISADNSLTERARGMLLAAYDAAVQGG